MSMMECAHCRIPCEGRDMKPCARCGGMLCEQCCREDDCPDNEDADFTEFCN